MPGQYDQKAAAALCIQLFAKAGSLKSVVLNIFCSRRYIPENLKNKELLYKSAGSKEAVLAKPETLEYRKNTLRRGIDAFTAMNKEELKSLMRKWDWP